VLSVVTAGNRRPRPQHLVLVSLPPAARVTTTRQLKLHIRLWLWWAENDWRGFVVKMAN